MREPKVIKELAIFACMFLIGIIGIIIVCSVPMPHFLGAAIGIVSSVLVIVGVVVLCAIHEYINRSDDDDGPHFYGPGGTVI